MKKGVRTFSFGLLFFVLFWIVGEGLGNNFGVAGLLVAFILMGACFFICQFLLSRGNPNALFKDWPIMLALNSTIIVVLFVSVLVEKQGAVFLFQALGILLICFADTFAGAFAASREARRKARQR